MDILNQFSIMQLTALFLVFIWTGFVRTGIGFGGAALGLPLLLLLKDDPLLFLPVIGSHLLFFTSLNLTNRARKQQISINWSVVYKVMLIIFIPKLLGLLGLISFPAQWLVLLVFSITLLYGFSWLIQYQLHSDNKMADTVLLFLGGYVSGTSLTGAPLIVAVVTKYLGQHEIRDTLFMLWIILVLMKMTTFVVYDIPLQWQLSILLLPFAGIGHYIGLKVHDCLIGHSANLFHRVLGAALMGISVIGIVKSL